jgi:endonuclease/exonuclease/phosphatase family metal-dependent hydrolase
MCEKYTFDKFSEGFAKKWHAGQVEHYDDYTNDGLAALSRTPITSNSTIVLKRVPADDRGRPDYRVRIAQILKLDSGFTISNIHLASNNNSHLQLKELMSYTKTDAIMGDFNMYGASEPGYRLLTQTYSNPSICFMDPLALVGGVGEWNNNASFTPFHTQSTRSYSDECFSSGGLDDRFDFILMADEIAFSYNHMRYVQGSYHAVGNDGNHFNQSVNQGYNSAVPAEVAEALFNSSDHLPVTMKIAVDVHLGVEDHEIQSLYATVAPNPASDKAVVAFFNPLQGQIQFELYSLQGQLMQRETAAFDEGSQQYELSFHDLTKGFYLLRIKHGGGWEQTVKLIVQ